MKKFLMKILPVFLVVPGMMAILVFCPSRSLASEEALNFATGLMVREEYALAIDELKGIVDQDAQFDQIDTVLFRLGESYYQLGRNPAALETFQRLTGNHPESSQCPQAFFRLGQILAEPEPLQAADAFSRLANQWPEHNLAPAARYRAGDAFLRAEQFEAAEAAFRRGIKDFPDAESAEHARYALGLAILRQPNRPAEALAAFDAFVKAHADSPRRPLAALKMADCLYALGRTKEALDAYRGLRDDPDPVGRDAARGVAWCLYDLEEFAGAVDAFAQAAELQKDSGLQATCLFNAGNSAFRAKAFERSTALFSDFVERFPAHELAGEARYWQGKSLMHLRMPAQAKALLKSLVEDADAAGSPPRVLYALAEAQRELGETAAAAERFEQVVEHHPDAPLAAAALYAAVLARDVLDEPRKVVTLATDLIRRYPESEFAPLAQFAMGESLFTLREYEKSYAAFTSADKLPDEVQEDRLYKMAWALFHLKRFENAAPRFQELADAAPDAARKAECRYMAGRAAHEAGKLDLARAQFTLASERFPNHPSGARASLALAGMDVSNAARSDSPEALYEAVVSRLGKLPGDDSLPDEIRSHAALARARALQQLGRHADALTTLREIGDADAAVAGDIAFATAWSLYKQDHHAKALQEFTALSKTEAPRAAEALFWRCRLLEPEDPAQAAAGYAAFLERFPDHPLGREARYRNALMLARSGAAEKAEKAFRGIARDDPGSAFAPEALYELAWLIRDSGDDAETRARAVAVFQELTEQFPQSDKALDALFRLGEAAQDQGDAEQALAWYRKVRELGGFHALDTLGYRIGWCHLDLEQFPQAERAFATLAQKVPDSPLVDEARYRAGVALKRQGLHPKAIEWFDAVAGGEFAEAALFASAESCRAEEMHRQAMERYRRLLKTFPEGPFAIRARLGLAHAQRAAGAHADAVETYARVVEATDALEAAQACLGSGYSRLALAQPQAAARDFLKVDIVYGYDELKPEALRMLVTCFEKMDAPDKAERYRSELKTRFPETP